MNKKIFHTLLKLGLTYVPLLSFADESMDGCVPCSTACPPFPQAIVTPEAAPCVRCPFDMGITADFIYWSIHEDDLQFVNIRTQGEVSSTPHAIRGTTQDGYPNWKVAPGFKVGLDLNLDYDGWDLFCEYTWLRSSPKTKTLNINPQFDEIWEGGISFFSPDLAITTLNYAFNWSLHFNVIDLALARNFFISPRLTLRPHVGLKGTWQEQKTNETTSQAYLGSITGITRVGIPNVENHLKYKGLGMQAGLDANWYFVRNFSLFGSMAATALWEVLKTHVTSYVLFPSAPSDTRYYLNTDSYNKFHVVCPVLESQIGLAYETWFRKTGYHVAINAGWELQWWCGQNRIGHTGTLGNLMLQGLTVGARLDF